MLCLYIPGIYPYITVHGDIFKDDKKYVFAAHPSAVANLTVSATAEDAFVEMFPFVAFTFVRYCRDRQKYFCQNIGQFASEQTFPSPIIKDQKKRNI